MHYSLIVIGNESLRETMEPFWQDLQVPEWCVGEVPESERQRLVDFYNEKTPGVHYSMDQFDELYKEKGEDWNYNAWRKDDDGVWREYARYNPDMQWDWYEVGGRWPGKLRIREGVEILEAPHFSWAFSEEEKREFLNEHPRCADIAYKGDIENIDTLTAYAVLKNGEWIEIEDEYEGKVAPFLADVTDDTLITCVDYHM